MNFDEAGQARRNLDAKKQNGELNEEAYCAEINKIRVTDARNCWWQPDPRGPGWLCWNGKEWIAGVPPGPGTVTSPAPTPGGVGKTASQKPAKLVEYHFRPVSDDEPGYKLMSLAQFIVIAKTRPWKGRPRKWWDLFSILTGVTLAILWLVYSSLNPRSEGWDLLTPVLMIAIPVILVSFRKPIDELLMPLQPHRAKFPHLLLLALGICVPFLIAFLLYNLFHVKEYSLIRFTMVIGTFIAYAITRDPVLAAGFTRKPGMNGTSPSPSPKVPLAALLFLTFVIGIVRGDDCATDPLNASDCLRTSGYSETIAGGASAAEAAANAAGDEAIDPKHTKEYREWLESLEPNTWVKDGDLWVRVDDNGVATYTNKDPGATGDGTTGTDTGTTGDDTTTPERTPPGQSKSTTVNPEDGSTTETTIYPDGKSSTVTTSADGKTVTTVSRNGDTATTVTNGDGTKTTTETSTTGEKTVTEYDPRTGVKVTTNPDNTVKTEYPNGTSVTRDTLPDNTTIDTYSDGTTVTTYPDKTVTTTTTWPDGTKTTTTQYPDGTTDVSERGGPADSPGDGSEPGGPGETGDGGETGGIGGDDK